MKKMIATAVAMALISNAGLAFEAGDLLIRAGVTQVSPDDSSGNVFVGGNDLGTGVNVDSNAQLGLNFAYFINDKWNIEVLAATPFSHDIGLNGVGQLGDTKHLPPTVTANYYFMDAGAAFQPYAGVGVNYTVFFDEGFTGANKKAGFSDLSLDNSIGLSAQLGFDYQLNSNWYFNASARWIDIDTEATFKLNGAAGKVSVDIDPYVYSLTFGYKF